MSRGRKQALPPAFRAPAAAHAGDRLPARERACPKGSCARPGWLWAGEKGGLTGGQAPQHCPARGSECDSLLRPQRCIDWNRDILKEELELTEDDILDLPQLFSAVKDKGLAYFPDTVSARLHPHSGPATEAPVPPPE